MKSFTRTFGRMTLSAFIGCAAMLLAGGAAAQDAASTDVRRPPAWITRPNMTDVFRGSSEFARPRDRDLSVRCQVETDGTLTDCTVEDQRGATVSRDLTRRIIAAMGSARMRPASLNGQPVRSSMVFTMMLRNVIPDHMTAARIVDPLWVSAPTAEEIVALRPPGMTAEGYVLLDCGLDRQGRPRDCDVRYERPLDSGLGQVLAPLASRFQTQMTLPDGKDYTDVRVDIGITLPGEETPDDISMLDRPTWIAAPTLDDLAPLFPSAARAQGIREGRATARCIVQPDGRLGECEVSNVTPAGVGFEEAVQAIAPMFAVSPWNGTAPSHGRGVRLPFVFVDPGLPTP